MSHVAICPLICKHETQGAHEVAGNIKERNVRALTKSNTFAKKKKEDKTIIFIEINEVR